MNDAEEQVRREVALFRYGLIADLIHLPPARQGLETSCVPRPSSSTPFRARCAPAWPPKPSVTGCSSTAAAASTPCVPKTRADRGRPRRLPPEVAELLLSIKAEHPSWSVRQVIAGAVASGHLPDGVRPAHSTVHRLLRAEGLMSKPTATSDGADRRRFSYRSAGQLWMSDVMHGPTVGDGTRRHARAPSRTTLQRTTTNPADVSV